MNCDCLDYKHDTRATEDCSHNKAFKHASNKARLVILSVSKKDSQFKREVRRKEDKEEAIAMK
jgi:hypothetical protein